MTGIKGIYKKLGIKGIYTGKKTELFGHKGDLKRHINRFIYKEFENFLGIKGIYTLQNNRCYAILELDNTINTINTLNSINTLNGIQKI